MKSLSRISNLNCVDNRLDGTLSKEYARVRQAVRVIYSHGFQRSAETIR